MDTGSREKAARRVSLRAPGGPTGERALRTARAAWPWLPLGIAAVYALLLLADFKGLVQAIYLSADIVSAPMLAELSDDAPPGSEVLLGNFPWYEGYWLETLTRWLPGHRQLWQVGPWILSLFGVALVVWSAWRAAGRWAGAMVAVALACANTGLLSYQFSLSIHSLAWVHVALLGAFLTLAAARAGLVGRLPLHLALCAGLAAITAVGVASDRLLLVAGVAPFALAGVALAALLPAPAGRRLAFTALGITAGAILLALPIAAAARDAGLHAADFPVRFATFDSIAPNVRILAESLAYLGGGEFGGDEPGFRSVLELLAAVAVLGGTVWAVRFTRDALVARGADRLRAADPAHAAHVTFWAIAGGLLALVFVLSSVPLDRFSARYVVGTFYAVAALVPVAATGARPWRRIAVVVGVSLVAMLGAYSLAENDLQANPSRYPTGLVSGPLEDLVTEEGVDHGYAGSWDAAPLTWQTKARARVYPIYKCPQDPRHYCPFFAHRISSWYTPKADVRTFLVVDRTQPQVPMPDPRFGTPERIETIGQLEVHIYGYDIASRLGP